MNQHLSPLSLAAALAYEIPSVTDAPQKLRILPAGHFAALDGRPGNLSGVAAASWRLSAQDAHQVIAQFAEAHLKLPIDYDHQTLRAKENGHPAPAAGWITALQFTDEGLIADVTWTDQGRTAVTSRSYLYVSPVFTFEPQTGAVLSLHSVALTNTPALNTLGEVAALAAAHINTNANANANLIGLDPKQFITLEQHKKIVDELASLKATHDLAEHDRLIEAALAHAVILPPLEAYWRKQPLAVLQAYLQEAQPAFAALTKPQTQNINLPNANTKPKQLTTEDLAVCEALGIKQDDFLKAK